MQAVADEHDTELKLAKAGAGADTDHVWPFHCAACAPPTAVHAIREEHEIAVSPAASTPTGTAGAGSIDQPMPAALSTLTTLQATTEAAHSNRRSHHRRARPTENIPIPDPFGGPPGRLMLANLRHRGRVRQAT